MPRPLRGATLTEMMVATAVLSVSVVGLMGSFAGIQRVVQESKTTTLASTLAQEQMQILKQKVYYQILITTNPAYDTAYSPPVEYDAGYFPPQQLLEGGIAATRYTMVQVVKEDSGAIVVLPPSTPDTGMKLVTVTVAWKIAGKPKRLTLRTLVANPDTVTANAIYNGTVRNAVTMAAIPGAVVNVAENLGWRDTAGAFGAYSINLSPGSFTLGVVVPGYFPAHRSVSIAGNQTKTEDFDLVPMSSGSATGSGLWLNPAPVISQVVVSTVQAESGLEVQYVELYNPTASPVTVGAGALPSGLKLKIVNTCGGGGAVTCAGSLYGVKLDYVNSTLPAYGHYLIASTRTFVVGGVLKTADAVYADDAASWCANPPQAAFWNTAATPPLKKLAPNGHGSVFYITDASDAILDAVGWEHGAASPYCEGSCMGPFASGAAVGQQFTRLTSTGAFAAELSAAGRAYDSGSNRVDFTTEAAAAYPPYSSADPVKTPRAGKPAIGAIVSSSDGLSPATAAYSTGGARPYAAFALTQIATGTWTVLISSGAWSVRNDTVTIAASGSVFAWLSTMTFLSSPNSDGFISGSVLNVLGSAISPAIPVDPGGAGAVQYASVSNGRYLLRVTPGPVDVVANSGVGAAANYVSASSLSVTATLGGIKSGVDFLLSQGGRVSGFVTRDGVNPLPGIAVNLIDVNGYSRDQPVSGSDGRFTSLNIATGTYSVEPALDSLETSSPTFTMVTVTPGGNVFSSSFTVGGAMGAITGAVTVSGQVLRTGALIVVTTATLAGTPPAIPTLDAGSLTGSPYYLTSTQEDGTYRLDVRQSTSPAYRIYAYYTTYNAGVPTINAQSLTNVPVLSGQTVTGKNFAW